jgi:ABC-type transport system substrate-binding protein
MEDPVVGTNKPLRQAISLAINRDEYIKMFLNDRGIPANGPIPPTFPPYDPEFKNPYSRFDPDLALKKLKEAEIVRGGPIPRLVMDFGGADTTTRQMGEYYTAAFAKIGLDLAVEYNTWPKFQDKIKSKACQIFTLGWVADYPDAENFLFLFYGKNVSPGPNNANYVNPEFDVLFEEATMTFDSPERQAEYRRLSQMVVEDCPWVFLFHPKGYTLYYDWVKNIHINLFVSGGLKYRRIDVDLRKRMSGTP